MKNKSILIVALCAALLCIVSCKKDQKGYSGNPVSLGLSVRWAETNAGAGNRGELGTKMTYDEAVNELVRRYCNFSQAVGDFLSDGNSSPQSSAHYACTG